MCKNTSECDIICLKVINSDVNNNFMEELCIEKKEEIKLLF